MRVSRLLVAITWAALSGCSSPPASGPRHPTGPLDLLVVTIDTARADRFPGTGGSPGLTPVLEELSLDGTVFETAISPTPITLPSHASLFTGQPPVFHGARNNGTYTLTQEATTLAEVLRGHSYRTGAFIAATVLRRKYGLDQGFDAYSDDVTGQGTGWLAERRGEDVVRTALSWLSSDTATPTFAWVHLFDPHAPYDPPEPERTRYAQSPYDGEIAYSDRMIGVLLDGLRAQGRYERTLIAVTSDHGESLGEHLELSHGTLVYDATQHVPLILRAPHVDIRSRVDAQVELIDLMPTLLSLLEVPIPESVHGRDLTPHLAGASDIAPRPAYLETLLPLDNYGWSELRGLRSGRWKYITGASDELYDLQADPGETSNLASSRRDAVSEFRQLLEAEYPDPGTAHSARLELDSESRRELEALGYLAPVAEDRREGSSRPDPRAMVSILPRNRHALVLFENGFHGEAVEQCRSILALDPRNAQTVYYLTRILLASGDHATVEAFLREHWASHPSRVRQVEALATSFSLRGRHEDALAALSAGEGVTGHRKERWRLLAHLGRQEQLIGEASRAVEVDPKDGLARAVLARAATTDVVGTLRAEHLELPDDPDLAFELGNALARRGDPVQALPPLKRAQGMTVTDEVHLASLVQTMAAAGDHAGVARALRAMGRLDVLSPEVWVQLGESCLAIGDRPCASEAMHRVAAVVPGDLEAWLAARPVDLDAGVQSQLLALASSATLAEFSTGDPSCRAERERGLATLDAGRATDAFNTLGATFRRCGPTLENSLAYARSAQAAGRHDETRRTIAHLAELLAGGDGDPGELAEHRLAEDQLRGQTAATLSALGDASWSLQRFEEAHQAYSLAARVVEDAGLFYNTGLCLEKMGLAHEALAAFRRALALDPEIPRAREHVTVLEESLRVP